MGQIPRSIERISSCDKGLHERNVHGDNDLVIKCMTSSRVVEGAAIMEVRGKACTSLKC